jgi:dCMP deaminase
MKCIVAYVPVLHKGYQNLFEKHGGTLYLVGPDFVSDSFPRLIRDLRQLSVEDMQRAVTGLGVCDSVQILTKDTVVDVNKKGNTVVMPDEDVSHGIAEEYLTDCSVTYDNAFLRWDKPITLRENEIAPDRVITTEKLHQTFMQEAEKESQKSGDWWRQIGALVVRDGTVLFRSYNKHLPSEHVVYATGNPRDNFDAGEHPEVYLTVHGEAAIIARAARAGISLEGADIYVTTFPCANCARLLTEAGIKNVYYRDGYSMLDAEDILKEAGVTIVLVQDQESH